MVLTSTARIDFDVLNLLVIRHNNLKNRQSSVVKPINKKRHKLKNPQTIAKLIKSKESSKIKSLDAIGGCEKAMQRLIEIRRDCYSKHNQPLTFKVENEKYQNNSLEKLLKINRKLKRISME